MAEAGTRRSTAAVSVPPLERKDLTAEQLERRRVQEERQRVLQGGVRRGPNAPASKIFGATK